MTISRDDLGLEGNTARRLFWEKCASNVINILPNNEENESVYQNWHGHEFVASFADSLLAEWDKRWIAEDDKDKLLVLNCSIDDLLDKMEEASAGGSLQSSWTRDKIADVIKKAVSNV